LFIEKTAYYYPEHPINVTAACFENEQLFAVHQSYVGTKVLYQSASHQTASDLAMNAALVLLGDVDRSSIDFLIFSSLTLDYHAPSTASVLHHNLGLNASCGVMDLPIGCAGFPMALMSANGLFNTMDLNRILILLGEVPTRSVHPDDPAVNFVFGDAGAAVLLKPSTAALSFEFGNDGTGFSSLNVLRGGARFPMDVAYLESNAAFPWLNQFGQLSMDGHGILKLTLSHIPKAVYSLLDKFKLNLSQIDHVIFHQASTIVIDALQRKLNIPSHKVINYLAEGGNTISCSIPIAWAKAEENKRFKDGDLVLIMGFGVGFSWCGTVLTYRST
jgi:3-oxoacyl-[acyl-carrier-protein] synthase-3